MVAGISPTFFGNVPARPGISPGGPGMPPGTGSRKARAGPRRARGAQRTPTRVAAAWPRVGSERDTREVLLEASMCQST